MNNSNEPFAAAAAALNAGLNPKQTIVQMLEPAGTSSSIAANAMSGQSSIGSLDAVASNTFASASRVAETASGALTSGSLLSADVPEPTALSLLAISALGLFWHRRRR